MTLGYLCPCLLACKGCKGNTVTTGEAGGDVCYSAFFVAGSIICGAREYARGCGASSVGSKPQIFPKRTLSATERLN